MRVRSGNLAALAHLARITCTLAALAMLWAACGASVAPGRVVNYDGGGSAADMAACKSTSPCDLAGATQCSGERVQQCTADAKGCLSWGPANPCALGQICDGSACLDVCALPAVLTACTQAAKDVNNCCASLVGGNTLDALSACQQFLGLGRDPRTECPKYTLQTDCATVRMLLGAGGGAGQLCCCEIDYVCDPETANKCILGCTSRASCSRNPGGPSCAPSGTGGIITQRGYVCRQDDGKPLHGCQLLANNGCDNGYDCWRDKKNNTVCTKSCNADADCGSPGVACCDKMAACNRIVGMCGGAGACLPCP